MCDSNFTQRRVRERELVNKQGKAKIDEKRKKIELWQRESAGGGINMEKREKAKQNQPVVSTFRSLKTLCYVYVVFLCSANVAAAKLA